MVLDGNYKSFDGGQVRYHGFICILIFLSASISNADTVVVKNGDRLTGKVKKMESGVLIIKTAYDPEIKIPWPQIQSLVTDTPIIIKLENGLRLVGRTVKSNNDNNLRIIDSGIGEVDFQLALVKEIRSHPKPPIEAHGYFNLSARTTRGNNKTDSYHGDGEVTVRKNKHRYVLGFAVNYGKNEEGIIQQDSLGYLRHDFFITNKLFFNNNVTALHDRFRDLDLRTTLGLGFGYQILDAEDHKLSVESGINYIKEDFQSSDDKNRAAARWALNYEQDFFDGGLTVFHYDEVLLGLGALKKEILVTLRNGLRIPLFLNFIGTLQINVDFNNDPAPDTQKTDLGYLLGVGYEF